MLNSDRLEIVSSMTGEMNTSSKFVLRCFGITDAISCHALLLIDRDAPYYLSVDEPRVLRCELGSLALRKKISLPEFLVSVCVSA